MPAKIDRLSDRAIARFNAALAPLLATHGEEAVARAWTNGRGVPKLTPHGEDKVTRGGVGRRFGAPSTDRVDAVRVLLCAVAMELRPSLPGLAYPWPSPWEPIGTRNWFEAHTTPTEAAVSLDPETFEVLLSVMASDHARAVFSVRAGEGAVARFLRMQTGRARTPSASVLTAEEAARDVPGATFADVLSERPVTDLYRLVEDGRACAWLPVPEAVTEAYTAEMLSAAKVAARADVSRALDVMADVVTGTVDPAAARKAFERAEKTAKLAADAFGPVESWCPSRAGDAQRALALRSTDGKLALLAFLDSVGPEWLRAAEERVAGLAVRWSTPPEV